MPRRVLHYSITTVPNNQRDPDGSNKINQRKENCVIVNRFDVRPTMVIVDLVELSQRLRLSVEDLNRLRASEMLLKKRIDPRDPGSHHVVTFTRTLPKPCRRSKQKRHGKQRHQRKLHI